MARDPSLSEKTFRNLIRTAQAMDYGELGSDGHQAFGFDGQVALAEAFGDHAPLLREWRDVWWIPRKSPATRADRHEAFEVGRKRAINILDAALRGISAGAVEVDSLIVPAMPDTARLFYSYASRDEALRRRLEVHLSLLKRETLLETWSFRQIGPGEDWKGVINSSLTVADIVLLLVSADFMASDYCWDIEMTCALERHANGAAIVIPVILKPCEWFSAPFAKLQALPDAGKPVTEWRSRDKAWLSVAEGLRTALKNRHIRTPTHSTLTRSNFQQPIKDISVDSTKVITHTLYVPGSGTPTRDRIDASPFFELVSASFGDGQLDLVVRNVGAPIVCQDFVAVTPGVQVLQWEPRALGTDRIFRARVRIDVRYPADYMFKMKFRDRWNDIRTFQLSLDTVSSPAKLDSLEDATASSSAG